MRSSRISRETAKLVDGLSVTKRQTRSLNLSKFLRSDVPPVQLSTGERDVGDGDSEFNDTSSLSSAHTADIEDLLTVNPPSKKRKRSPESPFRPNGATHGALKLEQATAKAARPTRKVIVKEEPDTKDIINRKPIARRTTALEKKKIVHSPPPDWETIYSTVKEMRLRNPTAPVDTMGCAELYWRSSSPRDRRFQTLVALMLSSQTKDTVTSVAMQRLHSQLPDQNYTQDSKQISNHSASTTPLWDRTKQTNPSTLTVENILAVSPARLNELIGSVGFHNNKTKYIKATAAILSDEYDSDIPSTVEGLMRLPGVGPKMAYLCMSAAWGRHEGIGVDVHVHRITNLWGWNKTKTPEATRAALEAWLPEDKWYEINKLLVGLGQTVCLPVGRKCGECDLSGTGLCKGEVKGARTEKSGKRGKNKPVKDEASPVLAVKMEIKLEDSGEIRPW